MTEHWLDTLSSLERDEVQGLTFWRMPVRTCDQLHAILSLQVIIWGPTGGEDGIVLLTQCLDNLHERAIQGCLHY